MASPVIDSITVTYPSGQTSLHPGQSATVTVVAHDPDSQTVQVAIVVTDSGGHAGTGNTPVTITDPITFAATAPSGTITGGGTSGVFNYTAP